MPIKIAFVRSRTKRVEVAIRPAEWQSYLLLDPAAEEYIGSNEPSQRITYST